jgi:hypothetical protein
MRRRLRSFLQTFPRFPTQLVKGQWLGWTARLSLLPYLAKAFNVFLAQFAFELPVADGLANNLAGRGIFTRFDSGLERVVLWAVINEPGWIGDVSISEGFSLSASILPSAAMIAFIRPLNVLRSFLW